MPILHCWKQCPKGAGPKQGPRAVSTALPSDAAESTLSDPTVWSATQNYYFSQKYPHYLPFRGWRTEHFRVNEPNCLGTEKRWTRQLTRAGVAGADPDPSPSKSGEASAGGHHPPNSWCNLSLHHLSKVIWVKKHLAYYAYKKANHFISLSVLNISEIVLSGVHWQPFLDQVQEKQFLQSKIVLLRSLSIFGTKNNSVFPQWLFQYFAVN